MKHSRSFIQRFVERLDYRSYEGDGWIIPMNGEPLVYYDDGSLAEESYWNALKDDIDGKTPHDMLRIWQFRLSHHNPGVYICRLMSSLAGSSPQ
jgi:hypothetical protein